MIDKNATATPTPNEIVIKLVEKEATTSVRTTLGRKPYWSRKEMPKATPKGMAKEKTKAKAGSAAKVTRVMRIRATGNVN
jgi:hypothetical protein